MICQHDDLQLLKNQRKKPWEVNLMDHFTGCFSCYPGHLPELFYLGPQSSIFDISGNQSWLFFEENGLWSGKIIKSTSHKFTEWGIFQPCLIPILDIYDGFYTKDPRRGSVFLSPRSHANESQAHGSCTRLGCEQFLERTTKQLPKNLSINLSHSKILKCVLNYLQFSYRSRNQRRIYLFWSNGMSRHNGRASLRLWGSHSEDFLSLGMLRWAKMG